MTRHRSFPIVDADSHIMELPNFLIDHAERDAEHTMPRIAIDRGGRAIAMPGAIETGRQHKSLLAEMVRQPEKILGGRKDYHALGAFNPGERSAVLDLLNIQRQVIFPSFSNIPVIDERQSPLQRNAVAQALNRAIAAFCAADPRMIGVGILPISDIGAALSTLDELIDLGLSIAWIPHTSDSIGAIGRPNVERIWQRMADSRTVLALHQMATPSLAAAMVEGNEIVPIEILDGDDQPRSPTIGEPLERIHKFLTKIVIDGVLVRHPRLRVLIAEFGATWAPGFMMKLDSTALTLAQMSGTKIDRLPSQQMREQCLFTPSHHEDVGALMRVAENSHLFAFSTDYPHIEGGADPIETFAASLDGCSDEDCAAFFAGNFNRFYDGR